MGEINNHVSIQQINLYEPSIFVLMSYSKVIVVFMVLIKNKLPRCSL